MSAPSSERLRFLENRVPGAGQIQKTEHLGRIGHARDDEADAENQASE